MAKKTATKKGKAPWASKPDVTVTPEPPINIDDSNALTFTSPTSSNIVGASYEPFLKELVVNFHGGRSYRYTSVPRDLWDDFDAAESRGQFFAARIKDKGFGGERLDG